MFKFRGAADEVPIIKPPVRATSLIAYFNELREFCGSIDDVLTMDIIEQWQRHSYVRLDKWERDCMFAMDRVLRHSYSDVLKFHAKRTKIKNDGNSGRRGGS